MAKPFRLLRDKLPPEAQAEARARANEMLEEIALQELRKALNLTQEQVAEAMQMNQGVVSKMEHQSDIYVSTLRKFVAALGGHLKLVASFPDKDVVINQFD
ncbi:MAG: helix-turn-helix transcriptional regulator [Acidobacteriota bacterium]|nr:helix-turn-helix transcriptional regulator [Acidobacteriota bacterium]